MSAPAGDDPIKAALEVAGEAARKASIKPGCCMEGTGCELPPCYCSGVMAAAAIAAFLRALGEDSEMHTLAIGLQTFQDVAAAVERAAGGGG